MNDALREDATGAPAVGRGARRSRLSALRRSPDLAAVLAILLPGAGHLYLGRFRAALGWFVAILVGYWAVFFPGLVLHGISIGAAYRAARTRPIGALAPVRDGA
ncbi:MAG: hypothetical protein IPK00_21950 [Deltaproteobacteria bacterium]|nr:hypothetical protein [Deltaproteobacteria bacterium]